MKLNKTKKTVHGLLHAYEESRRVYRPKGSDQNNEQEDKSQNNS